MHEPWKQMRLEHREALLNEDSAKDWKVPVVLVTCAVSLTLLEYIGSTDASIRLTWWLSALGFENAARSLREWLYDPDHGEFHRLQVWAYTCFFTYTILPTLVIWFVFRERLSDYGMKLRGAFSDWWIYVVMFSIMVTILLFFSQQESFQRTYPFYDPPKGKWVWSHFWWWEILYILQFFSLEMFFRGFILHGLKHRLGTHAIFVMVVPYCMIHFGKPMLETFAAILAGIALGFMSLKTRSIWLGGAIHVTVAMSMDFLSLWRQGFFS